MLSLQPYVLEMCVYLKKYYHYKIIEYTISFNTHPADQWEKCELGYLLGYLFLVKQKKHFSNAN